uniref:Transmembrane protein 238 n=1 Tax=Anabas testudineus TaxID=64144 RepID=A0A3Q1K8C9_ANATE
MGLQRCVGGCVPLFLIAVVLDLLGLTLLFVGIFANLQVDERFYGDFLIYTGSLIIFLSLGFWIMWYVWNVPVSEDDGLRKSHSVVVKLARKLTERLMQHVGSGKLLRKDSKIWNNICYSNSSNMLEMTKSLGNAEIREILAWHAMHGSFL